MNDWTPAPKPEPRVKTPRPPKARKPMKRGGRVKPVNAERKAENFVRCFHSLERVEFVKSLPCLVGAPSCKGSVQNAHVVKDGSEGASRKGGYRCIAPLCRFHHIECLHRSSQEAFEKVFGVDLQNEADRTELAWLGYSGQLHTLEQRRNTMEDPKA